MIDVDVLLIAHKRAAYLAKSLPTFLDSLPSGARAWIWQNGTYAETREVIERHRSHPRLHRFHHSSENRGLAAPTNWLWTNSEGALLGKVDDDCLVPEGWIEAFVDAHARASLGIVAAWHFPAEDLWPETVASRTTPLGDDTRLIRNCWVGGSGYLMKRSCVLEHGPLSDDRGFTKFCIDVAAAGWEVGWHYPLVLQDHMDDPRSSNAGIRTDDDLRRFAPLSAAKLPDPTVDAWLAQLQGSARTVQTASLRPADHRGWRRRLRRLRSLRQR